MARKLAGKKKKLSLSERLIEEYRTVEAAAAEEEARNKQGTLRKMVEDAKSLLALEESEASDLELLEENGLLFVRYDDVCFVPYGARSASLVTECPHCKKAVQHPMIANSWAEFGKTILLGDKGLPAFHLRKGCLEDK